MSVHVSQNTCGDDYNNGDDRYKRRQWLWLRLGVNVDHQLWFAQILSLSLTQANCNPSANPSHSPNPNPTLTLTPTLTDPLTSK